jgi:hypothetical protein
MEPPIKFALAAKRHFAIKIVLCNIASVVNNILAWIVVLPKGAMNATRLRVLIVPISRCATVVEKLHAETVALCFGVNIAK